MSVPKWLLRALGKEGNRQLLREIILLGDIIEYNAERVEKLYTCTIINKKIVPVKIPMQQKRISLLEKISKMFFRL